MPEGWEWDETLFQGSAAYYVQGRMPYASDLPAKFAEALGTDGSGRLLDVGCGPGTVALQLAPLFAEVVGVDADRDMVAEAMRLAREAGVGSARFVCMRAEELPADLGRFRVATVANSFHWMDREQVAGTVFDMLELRGALVQVDSADVVPPDGVRNESEPSHPFPPYEEVMDLVRSYIGPGRRAGRGVLAHGTPSNESEVVMGAGFGPPETVFVGGGELVTRSEDDVVASVFTNSAAAPHLFGDDVARFERDLCELLRSHSADGAFTRRIPFTQLRIWRKPG